MKIALFYLNKGLNEKGGAYVQAIRTYEAIRKLGHHVSLHFLDPGSFNRDDVPRGCDVYHFIGEYSVSPQLIQCIKDSSPHALTVLSPIYWLTPRVIRVTSGTLPRFVRYAATYYLYKLLQHKVPRFRSIPMIDLLIPNSPAEGYLFREHRPVRKGQFILPAPNGVDPIPAELPVTRHDFDLPDDYLLCMGTYNRRKNQLGLIRALKKTSIPLVLVGKPSIASQGGLHETRKYLDLCREEANGNTYFVDFVPHGSPEWYHLVSKARAAVMPTACETPSLAALEAALMAKPLAITDIGSTYEYFGPYAEYCQPINSSSIRRACETAMERGPAEDLRQHVTKRFLWSSAARVTIKAYTCALSRSEADLNAYRDAIADMWFSHPGKF